MTPTHTEPLSLLPSESSVVSSLQTLPVLPRFVRDLVVIPREEEVVVDGGRELHVLRGEATRNILIPLIELADGTRTPEQIATSIPGIPPEHVLTVLNFLYSSGLVEEGSVQQANQVVDYPETLAFLRRCIGATHTSRSGLLAYERLQASEVLLLNSGRSASAAEGLKDLLEKSGVGCVTSLDRQSLARTPFSSGAPAGQTLVVYLAIDGEDGEFAEALDDWCSKHHVSWFRAVLDTGKNYSDLGPIFNRKRGPCYRCFYEIHGKTSSSEITQTAAEVPYTAVQSWISEVAVEAIYFLAGIVPSIATGKDFRRYDSNRNKSTKLSCARVPGCLNCRPLRADMDVPVNTVRLDTAVVFEEAVGLLSRNSAGANTELETFKPSLIRPPKRLTNSRRSPLPQQQMGLELKILEAFDKGRTLSTKTLNINELGTILLMTAGIRDRRPGRVMAQRWAATAGNLGSVELFVAVNNVDGLEPGFYFYQSADHSLSRIERHVETLMVKDFVSRVVPFDGDDAPWALILFTGAFHRVARKYGPFGYRLTYLDAGAAMGQLHLVARALNIGSRTAVCWPDDLIEEVLNLEQLQEQVTGMVALSSRTSYSKSVNTASSELRTGLPASARTARSFFEVPLEALLELVHHESRTKEKELHLPPFTVPTFLTAPENNSPLIRLPLATKGGRPVGEVLAGRKSVREFTNDPVSIEQLSTMLKYAHTGDANDWPDEQRYGLPLTFLALASRVSGLAPGVYKYEPVNHSLSLFAAAPSDAEKVELFVQAEFALAPLCVWIVGNLAAAWARHGAFGHRQLLLRAGTAGHRLWMAALATGLSGCLVAGVIPGAARRQIGIDGYKQASLLGVAAGYEIRRAVLPVRHTDQTDSRLTLGGRR